MLVRRIAPSLSRAVNSPVWSVIFGAAVLAEPLPPSLLLALAMILSGVALSQLGGLRRLFGRG